MISDPNLIFYTCIATGTTILAEFNSRDADMATLALKCQEKTPKHHISFTHTSRNQSHTFLIDSPFVYLAIYGKYLEYPEALSYLKSIKDTFDVIHLNSDKYQSRNLVPHCFQGELNPVFHQLLAPKADLKSVSLDLEKEKKKFGGRALSPRSLTKKKKRFGNGDSREGLFENKVDLSDRGLPVSVFRSENKARRVVWKRHVWVVLTLDFVLCLVLFGVWLWICSGFKCIHV